MIFNYSKDSFRDVTDNSPQVFIIGQDHCSYYELREALNLPNSPLKRLFHWQIAQDLKSKGFELNITLEGRKIEQIPLTKSFNGGRMIKRWCKMANTNIVFENFKRRREELPIIPLMMCLDRTDNPYPNSSKTVTTKKEKYNSLTFYAEFRRCYKLCTFGRDNRLDAEIREVAKQTIRCVKLELVNGEYVFTKATPYWEQDDWKACWEERKKQSNPRRHKENYWVLEFYEAIRKYVVPQARL